MGSYRAIFSELVGRPHLVLPQKGLEILRLVEARSAGIEIPNKVIATPWQSLLFNASGSMAPVRQRDDAKYVAVLPLFGLLWQHGGMEMQASGGMSLDWFGQEFVRLASNPAIKSIIIETHSPGGQVWGTEEISDLIFDWRLRGKRIIGVVNSMAASGALWVLTAATEIAITSGGEMGSIGVFKIHEDVSRAEEKAGIKTTLIAYPEKKVAGHEFAPLGDDVRDEMMAEVKQTYQRFVKAVARNRGVSTSTVENKFGGGGMLRADQAVAVGLADRIATKQQIIDREVKLIASDSRPRSANSNRLAALAAGCGVILPNRRF